MAKNLKVEEFIETIYNNKGMVEAQKDTEKLAETGEKLNKTMTKAFGLGKLGVFAKGISKATQGISYLTKKSADFVEQLNVLDVAFDGNTDSIRKFTSTISETLNLDEASIIKMAAAFKTLGNSMNYSQDLGNRFSRMMTQVTLDTASLFNMSLEKSQSMMQSAIQGQGKSLKTNTGVSVLETTVQTTLDVLGIDAYVEDMNDAEKALARTIAITYQLRNAQGDLARTIEAPANRMRVLGEQINQLARNIGNVLLPIINAILPYLNAVLIVLNKIISSLARLVGFKENAWDNYESNAESLGDAFDNLGTSIGGVGNAAKETKKQLMGLRGFDKLNVIKTPTPSSGGGGAGGGGGINQNLLDAFNKIKYKSALEGIETEATKIAKRIMKALGDIDFTNLINSGKNLWEAFKPFAENVGKGLLWMFNNVLKPLAKWTITDLLPAFLDLLASRIKVVNTAIETLKPLAKILFNNFLKPLATFTGKVIVNWMKGLSDTLDKISKSKFWSTILVGGGLVLKLSTNFGKLADIVKKSKLLTMFNNLISPTKSLFGFLKDGIGVTDNLGESIKITASLWKQKIGIISTETGKLNGTKGIITGLTTALQGLVTASLGYAMVTTAFEDIGEHGLNLTNVLGGLTGAFATISGSITTFMTILPASLGPYALAIGAVVGVVGTLISAWSGYETGHDKTMKALKEETNQFEELNKTMKDQHDQVNDNISAGLEQTRYHENLVNELQRITDENGNVKKGYEDRAARIIELLNEEYKTELKITDGKIENYEREIEEIKKTIKMKQAEIILKQNEEYYVKLMSQEADLYNKMTNAENKYNDKSKERAELENKIKEAVEKGQKVDAFDLIQLAKLKDEEAQLMQTRDEAKKAYEYNQSEKARISNLETSIEKGNYAEITQAVYDYTNQIETSNGKVAESQKVGLERLTRNLDERKKAYEENATETNKINMEAAQRDYDNFIDNLTNQTKALKGDVGEDLIGAWITLGKTNEAEFMKQFEQLEPDIRQKVIDKMGGYGYDISKNLQDGLNQLDPTLKITADTTAAKNAVNNMLSKLKTSNIKGAFGSMFKDITIPFANGGMPSVGQLFIANERGPELVGQIGGQSFVANQNQMMDLLDRKLGSVNNSNGGVYNIYLDKDHKLGTYTLEQLQGMAKSNGRPITIG